MGKPRLIVLSFVMITFLFALQGLIPSSGTVSLNEQVQDHCRCFDNQGKVVSVK